MCSGSGQILTLAILIEIDFRLIGGKIEAGSVGQRTLSGTIGFLLELLLWNLAPRSAQVE